MIPHICSLPNKGQVWKVPLFQLVVFFHYSILGCSFCLLSSCKSNKHINLPFTISHLISTNVLGQRHANFFESWWKHHGGISIFWQLLLTEVNLEICIWENLAKNLLQNWIYMVLVYRFNSLEIFVTEILIGKSFSPMLWCFQFNWGFQILVIFFKVGSIFRE